MPLSVGQPVPDTTLTTMVDGDPTPVSSAEVLGRGRVVLFGVPGAFTPTCSEEHLPGFVRRAGELYDRGVSRIACTAVNDIFVLEAWGAANGAGNLVLFLADGNGDFAEAADLAMDSRDFGMGIRSRRYAAVLEDGVVAHLFVEDNPLSVGVSGIDSVRAKV